MDGMTKADLVHYLSDISTIKRKYFGDINIQKNFAFFEVDNTQDKELAVNFAGITIDGREIRINLDEDGDRRKVSTQKKKSRDNRRKSRHGGHGGGNNGGGGGKSDFGRSRRRRR